MFISLDKTLDYPWSPQVSPDSADLSPPVVEIATFTTYNHQPTLSLGASSGTAPTDAQCGAPTWNSTPSRPSGGTLRRTSSISCEDTLRAKQKQPFQDVLDIGNTIENEAPYIPSVFHGKSHSKKLKDRMKPVSVNAVHLAADHSSSKSRKKSASNAPLEGFLNDLTKEAKQGITTQQSRRALADIWANASTFPKGLDISEDHDRPSKRAKSVEDESSQAGVNAPSTREAPNVHLLSLQEFWAQTTSLNRPSIHLAGPAAPPGLPIPDRAFRASQALTRSNYHSNNVQLGADDLYMSFSFDKSPHFEFWDMQDDAYFLCAAQINLLAIHPSPFRYKSLPLPQIKMIDIQCYTRDLDTTFTDSPPEHTINYTGTRTQDDKKNAIPVVPADGIAVEPEWFRLVRFGGARENNKRGWYLNAYVPIPAKLFVKKETRTFVLRASVWIGDEQEIPVGATQEITVSHLRKEREMF